RLADPVAAAGALLEERRDLLDRLAQRRVVLRAGDHLLQRLGRLRRSPEDAAEQVRDRARRAGDGAEGVGLEGRHVAVAALLAHELELVPAVRRQVLV